MKNRVLELLEAHKNSFVNGEDLATSLQVTRANIWKIIQKLRHEGYDIESLKGSGYRLNTNDSMYSRFDILSQTDGVLEDVIILDSIDSTNVFARSWYEAQQKTNVLILANTQTDGKGRRGRRFYSPKSHGIYMSLIIKPTLNLNDSQLITIVSALAIRKAIFDTYGIDLRIKWLNDLYSRDYRKICGILTEGEISLESQDYRYLVIGIGLNVYDDATIPEEIRDIYGSLETLTTQTLDRNTIVSRIVTELYDHLQQLETNKAELMATYRALSNVLGKTITTDQDPTQTFTALDISDAGHLIIADNNHKKTILVAGDVSIKETL